MKKGNFLATFFSEKNESTHQDSMYAFVTIIKNNDLICQRSVRLDFLKFLKNQNQGRLKQPSFLQAISYIKDLGFDKKLYLCEKKSTFRKIEPYASLANFHTYSEASNPCASKVTTRLITFNKSKIQKKSTVDQIQRQQAL